MATFRMPPPKPKLQIVQPKVDYQSGGSGADVQFSIAGLEALAETLRSMPQVARDSAGYEMADIAHEIIEDARDNYVPFRFGALKDSGDADEYKPGPGAPEITEIAMWFGGPPTGLALSQAAVAGRAEGVHIEDPSVYALEQHENLEFHHHPPPDQTGPKYLERPLLKVQDTVAPRIAKAIGLAWGTDAGLADIESGLRGMPNYPGYGAGYTSPRGGV